MKTIVSLAAMAAVALGAAGAAHAQIDGGRAWVSPIPYFKDLPKWDPTYKAPRTPDGKPDLQGVWSVASLTQLERGAGYGGGIRIDTLVIPEDKVNDFIKDAFYTKQYKEQAWTDPRVGAGDGKGGGDVRGYNAFWIDPGAEYAKINGEYRSSWITSTANGRIPWSEAGRKARQARMAEFRSARNTGPEARTIGDRCLISYTGQAGPPLVNAMYNNHIQIVQSPTSMLMNVEMNHDARVIGIDARRRPEAVKQWFGDSVGRWEGETLVVETRNVHPIQSRGGFVPLSPQGKVTEKFTRKSEQEILYEFAVEDPNFYSETWKGEMLMRKSKESLYEYACHEGNYALPGMLRGDAMGMDTAIDEDGE
jgi:hypothetical protein